MILAAQTADDPRAFRAEQAELERARALVGLLLRTTGACPRALALGAGEAERERLRQLEHFAGIARAGLRHSPSWRPSPLLSRALAARGLSLAEVLAHV